MIPSKRFDIFSLRLGDAQKVEARSDFSLNSNTILCGAIRLKQFPMKILSEIARIFDRILVENRSSEISDRKLPISDSVRHGFFLPIGNRQFPMGKKRQRKKRSKCHSVFVLVSFHGD